MGKVILTLLTVIVGVCQVPWTLAALKEDRNLMPNVPLMTGGSSTPVEGNMENQIVGTIPLIPTLKFGLVSAISTLFLPGLHFTLTVITMVFALIGVASFICSTYDCRNIFRRDDGFGSKSRHPMYHKNSIGIRPWETVPGIRHSLENSYSKYKDHRND